MPKKQSRKKKYLSGLLVLGVIIAFVLVTFVTIIITQGGKFTRDGIVDTGSIKVQIEPSRNDITSYLDGEEKQIKDGFITGVRPGEHTLKIESPEFHIWENSLIVRPGLVTEVNVKLFPLEPELEQITETQIDKVFFSQNGAYAYYTVTDENLPISSRGLFSIRIESDNLFFRRNVDSEKLASANDEVLNILNADNFEITPTNNNSKLLITAENNSEVFVYDFTQSNSTNQIIDVTKALGFNPKSISWINDNNSLLIEDDNLLFEHNLSSNEKTIIVYTKEQNPIYSSNSEVTYIFKPEDRKIYSYQNKVLTPLEIPEKILPLDIVQIEVSYDGTGMLLKSANDFYYLDINSLKTERIISDAELLDFSYNGLSAIFLKDNIVNSMTIERILAQDEIEIENIITKISPDTNPRYIFNTELLVFNDENAGKLYVSESDGTNKSTILGNEQIDNGFYAFQPEGTSVTVLIETDQESNNLLRNLYKANLSQSSLPFNL